MTALDLRLDIRHGRWSTPTAELGFGYVQANVIALPEAYALDFLFFCLSNPQPCPVIDILEPGTTEPRRVAPGADIRTDVPLYRLYANGELSAESSDASQWWRSDLVTFLLGCSFSFDFVLQKAGLPVRHVEQKSNVPMFVTDIRCEGSGPFGGPLVVSMRPMTVESAEKASDLTAQYPELHGGPIHIGDHSAIGVQDLDKPDFGDPVTILPDEVPVFWACGVTSHLAVRDAKLDIVITHSPGHMFITDLKIPESPSQTRNVFPAQREPTKD